jgi:hypothetical protein
MSRKPAALVNTDLRVDDSSGALYVDSALEVLGTAVVTVSVSATIQALVAAAGKTIPAGTRVILIRPVGAGVWYDVGAEASAADPHLAADVLTPLGFLSTTDLRLFYHAVNTLSVELTFEG